MSLFAISDLHLSLGASKPMDIFEEWHNYVEIIEKNWKNSVAENDCVVIAGDISWAMNLNEAEKDFKFIDSLPGEKIIIKGNHDFWWSSVRKISNFFKEKKINSIKVLQNLSLESQGFCICGTRGWVCKSKSDRDKKIVHREVERLRLSFKSSEKSELEKVVFMHYPPVYDKEENELMGVLVENNVNICYYGHVHGKHASGKAVVGKYRGVNLEFISCDYLGFKPRLVG
ncbi:MAG: metallophosphoesterase [Oscillospiraceae bacterium]|jgi:predicted phosphohydrolase|nr:metallophosphoesterase [Oscillospiraceae bacterium]